MATTQTTVSPTSLQDLPAMRKPSQLGVTALAGMVKHGITLDAWLEEAGKLGIGYCKSVRAYTTAQAGHSNPKAARELIASGVEKRNAMAAGLVSAMSARGKIFDKALPNALLFKDIPRYANRKEDLISKILELVAEGCDKEAILSALGR
jgi:hypothetical protein